MARARFKMDKNLTNHLEHPKPKTSLHPIGDSLRQVSDDIRDDAKAHISHELARKEAEVRAIKSGSLDANAGKSGQGYLRAKAERFALKSAHDTTVSYMTGVNGKMAAKVAINRTGSSALEYGGEDFGVTLGQGSKQHPVHPAYAFLRRAADRAAR